MPKAEHHATCDVASDLLDRMAAIHKPTKAYSGSSANVPTFFVGASCPSARTLPGLSAYIVICTNPLAREYHKESCSVVGLRFSPDSQLLFAHQFTNESP